MISYRDTLYHDGKPGMHWGVRKYRNYDGTLTEAGRKRYGVGPARNKSEDGGRKLSRAERKAAKEIKKKASAKAAEKKAKQMRDEARKALEELQKERAELDRARADREQNSATAEGNAQMKLNNDLLKLRIEQLTKQREYDALLHPKKDKVRLTKRLADVADDGRKIAAFAKDLAEVAAAIKKAKNGDTKSAMDLLKDQDALDKLKFGLESRKRTRESWAEADAKKAGNTSDSQTPPTSKSSNPSTPQTPPAPKPSQPSTPQTPTAPKPSASQTSASQSSEINKRAAEEVRSHREYESDTRRSGDYNNRTGSGSGGWNSWGSGDKSNRGSRSGGRDTSANHPEWFPTARYMRPYGRNNSNDAKKEKKRKG